MLNISSRSATPLTGFKTTPLSGRRSMPASTTTPQADVKVPRLVDISGDDDDEDAAITQFGHLKVGFTPGVDGKTRRVRVIVCFQCNQSPVTTDCAYF